METETSRLVSRLENGISRDDITSELKAVSDDIQKGRDPEAASKMLQEVLTEANRRGLMSKLTRKYVLENFNDFDLNGDGYVGKPELSRIADADLLAQGTSPLGKGILRYANQNVEKIAAAHNDILGGSQRLSKKDLTKFDDQSRVDFARAINAAGMMTKFGNSQELFNRLGPDKKGYVSDAQLKSNIASSRFSNEEKQLMQFMLDNRKEISKAYNDQWGFENKISFNDVRKFSERYQLPALPGQLSTGRDFQTKAPAVLDTAKHHLPDVILDFGRQHQRTLDFDENGYVSRAELKKLLDSAKWSKALGPEGVYVMRQMDEKLEQIGNSNREEWWYKDRKGLTVKDFENYAEHQRRNRGDIPTTPGDHNLTLMIGGIERRYLMHIPPGGPQGKPLVIMAHCLKDDHLSTPEYSGMTEKADKEGFTIVYPRAEGWIGKRLVQWNLNNRPSYRVDEVAFVGQLMDKLEDKLASDKSRLYVVGYSNGGMLAHEIATKFSDRVAGMAAVGSCTNGKEGYPANPVPVLMVNGTKDKLVPYNGRWFTPLFGRFMSVKDSRDHWALANGTTGSMMQEIAPGVKQETLTGPKGADVVVVTLQGAGHGWPGRSESIDGNAFTGVDGADLVWNFLKRQQKKDRK